jgi:hypothetical protein
VKTHQFFDGKFTFWTVRGSKGIWTFRVRDDSTPEKRAPEKGLVYHGEKAEFTPASEQEISSWFVGHPSFEAQYLLVALSEEMFE